MKELNELEQDRIFDYSERHQTRQVIAFAKSKKTCKNQSIYPIGPSIMLFVFQ